MLTSELAILGGSHHAWVCQKGQLSCLLSLRQRTSTCGILMDRRGVWNAAYPDLFDGFVFILKPSYQMAIDCSLPPP